MAPHANWTWCSQGGLAPQPGAPWLPSGCSLLCSALCIGRQGLAAARCRLPHDSCVCVSPSAVVFQPAGNASQALHPSPAPSHPAVGKYFACCISFGLGALLFACHPLHIGSDVDRGSRRSPCSSRQERRCGIRRHCCVCGRKACRRHGHLNNAASEAAAPALQHPGRPVAVACGPLRGVPYLVTRLDTILNSSFASFSHSSVTPY